MKTPIVITPITTKAYNYWTEVEVQNEWMKIGRTIYRIVVAILISPIGTLYHSSCAIYYALRSRSTQYKINADTFRGCADAHFHSARLDLSVIFPWCSPKRGLVTHSSILPRRLPKSQRLANLNLFDKASLSNLENVEYVRDSLEHGANPLVPKIRRKWYYTSFSYRAIVLELLESEKNDTTIGKIVRLFLEYCTHPKIFAEASSNHLSPLYESVKKNYLLHTNHFQVTSLLLDAGADIEKAFTNVNIAWKEAIDHGCAPLVRSLISKGYDPNVKDDFGLTPLHWATVMQDEPLRRTLLAEGANPDIRSTLQYKMTFKNKSKELGKTVWIPAGLNYREFAKKYLQFAAFGILCTLNSDCYFSLHFNDLTLGKDTFKFATFESAVDCLLDINETLSDGNTLFHLALKNPEKVVDIPDEIGILLNKNPNLFALNNVGHSPLTEIERIQTWTVNEKKRLEQTLKSFISTILLLETELQKLYDDNAPLDEISSKSLMITQMKASKKFYKVIYKDFCEEKIFNLLMIIKNIRAHAAQQIQPFLCLPKELTHIACEYLV